jgi:hypothetical protein
VSYTVSWEGGRCSLDASWTLIPEPVATTVEEAVAGGVLGVDLNAGHLAT